MRSQLAHSSPVRAPTRLLIVHRPAGTVPASYDCVGVDREYVLSEILAPFADLKEHMVVVDGLEVRKAQDTPGEDHGNCIITFMTGGVPYRPGGTSLALAERISIDQVLANDPSFSGNVPIRSLQLTASDLALQFFVSVLAYAGRGQPMPPERDPLAAFARVFGTTSSEVPTPDQLERIRARKQSILDFTRDDARRLRARLGAAGRTKLDRHLEAIREVEQIVQRTIGFDGSALRADIGKVDIHRRDEHHGAIGRAHLDVVRAAFQCDLTRVASFLWGSMEVNLSRVIPGLTDITYHQLSHYAGAPEIDRELVTIHHWYNVQLAAFLRTMRDTPDVDGYSLLDNTLVVVWSEIRLGSHSFDNLPIQLFGGAGGRLAGGRLVRYSGHSTNDLWLTIANALGQSMTVFGDAERNTGELAGLFSSVTASTPR